MLPFIVPNFRGGGSSSQTDSIFASGLPRRVTITGSRMRWASLNTAMHLALNSDIRIGLHGFKST